MTKKAWVRGTHRTSSPADTVARFRAAGARMGITRLANITGLDCIGIPVWTAIRPNSRSLATSQGKGLDDDTAKASALGEAIEAWHSEWIDAPLRYESWFAMRASAPVLPLDDLPMRSGGVARPDTATLWIRGADLVRGGPVWVPYDLVSQNYVDAPGYIPSFFRSGNGLASGNHVLEATAHAIYELVERDAVSGWTFVSEAQIRASELDLETVRDPLCAEAIARIRAAGVDVAAWDVTNEIGVPVYACTILEPEGRPRWRAVPTGSGFGCHLAPEVALLRAITEAVQCRATVIAGSRDDLFRMNYAALNNDDQTRRKRALMAKDGRGPVRFDSRASGATDDFEADVAAILGALRRAGFAEAAVVDLTKESIGIPVVKAIIPGLECPIDQGLYQHGRRAKEWARAERARGDA